MKNLFHSQSAKVQKQKTKFIFIGVVNDEDYFEGGSGKLIKPTSAEKPAALTTQTSKQVTEQIHEQDPEIKPWMTLD